jgi:hypothetical protein
MLTQARVHSTLDQRQCEWIPAFAGMTIRQAILIVGQGREFIDTATRRTNGESKGPMRFITTSPRPR